MILKQTKVLKIGVPSPVGNIEEDGFYISVTYPPMSNYLPYNLAEDIKHNRILYIIYCVPQFTLTHSDKTLFISVT